MRLVHAADIHLDSPLRGLTRIGTDNAMELRRSSRKALANMVDLVLKQKADLLVIAGDLYDGNWHDFSTGQFFIDQMIRLNDEGVPVVVISGNHDAASQITRSLKLPPMVHLLATDAPESIRFDDLGAVVHGQGYEVRDVRDNLAAAYPNRIPDLINIGVLHTAGTGSPNHDNYAPCSGADLQALRYDYMALGHIHQRGPIAEGEFPAYFSGNLQGRNPKETGPKGVLVVDLEPRSAAEVSFEAVDVARWDRIDIDSTGMADYDELAETAGERVRTAVEGAEGRSLIVRMNVTGTSAVARNLTDDEGVRADMANIASQAGAILDKVTVRVRPPAPPDPEAQRMRTAVEEAAIKLAQDKRRITETMQVLERSIRDIASSADGYSVDLTDTMLIESLLEQAHNALDSRLTEARG